MHRDGFQCIMTGVYDFDCKPELQPRGPLDAAHIVEPSLAIFNEEVGDAYWISAAKVLNTTPVSG